MKLVMTLMVRDEADIIGAMVAHHQQQGVDLMIVTDNGSIDGTTEILQKYADEGFVELRHDPVHLKQQFSVVTTMARDAYTKHQADWVINADADEFWIPKDPTKTLRQAFEGIPTDLQAFDVPVTDMTGAPALAGTGLQRLIYRDTRDTQTMKRIGLRDHATHDAVHVGSADVEVSQGNHFVSLTSLGQPEPEFAIEVLHFPWRSWEQFRRKVENAGKAYDANPNLLPSPNHHGMRDYRHLKEGTLRSLYAARCLSPEEIAEASPENGLTFDETIAKTVPSPIADELFDPVIERMERDLGLLRTLVFNQGVEIRTLEDTIAERNQQIVALRSELNERHDEIESLKATVESFANRKVVRVVDQVSRKLRGSR